VAGGGLTLGFHLPFGIGSAAAQSASDTAEINAWVVVKPDDTLRHPHCARRDGQGTLTGLAQLVAEELECDWKKVTAESITAGQNLARKRVWGDMSTSGSRGIRTSHDYVRRGGAAARMMLIAGSGRPVESPGRRVAGCQQRDHPCGVRTFHHLRQVASAAAKLTAPDPKSIKLKEIKDWKVAGKPVRRLDTADKLNVRKSMQSISSCRGC